MYFVFLGGHKHGNVDFAAVSMWESGQIVGSDNL